MAIKNYFTGKSGLKFWFNIFLMLFLIVAVPVLTFILLDTFTHHGEKIEVPSVIGRSLTSAERMLEDRGLVAVVVDSAYDKSMMRGAVLDQSPAAGYEVKGGRVIYLTVNMNCMPLVQLPDVVNRGSLREGEALLKSLGFQLTSHEVVMDKPKDLIIGVKQRGHDVFPGQKISIEYKLTIVIGGGEIDSTEIYPGGPHIVESDTLTIDPGFNDVDL